MKTLMEDQKVRTKPEVFNAISFGVDSVVAKNLWDSTDPKSCEHVSADDIKKIEGALRKGKLNSFVLGSGAPKNPPLIVYSQPY